jgi:hypothetical protein
VSSCDFEEKEYEVQMNVELACPAAGRRYLVAPGQVLEHLLGYDAAVDPSDNSDPIWAALNEPRPSGVRLLPTTFPRSPDRPIKADRLPSRPVSLLLQYKCPYYLERRPRR